MMLVEMVREEANKLGNIKLSDLLIDHIIWEETGYPAFWNIPKDGNTPEECFRKQVKEALLKVKDYQVNHPQEVING